MSPSIAPRDVRGGSLCAPVMGVHVGHIALPGAKLPPIHRGVAMSELLDLMKNR